MTLAVCEGSRIVLRIDMLKHNTLKAGDDGKRLCSALNDLFLIAELSSDNADIPSVISRLPYGEEGNSPFPWEVSFDNKKLMIRSTTGSLICDKPVAKRNHAQIKADYYVLVDTVHKINQYWQQHARQ